MANTRTNPAESCVRQDFVAEYPEERNRKLYNPWHPNADHAVTAKLARATPTRIVEMERPGPVKIWDMTYGGSVHKPRAVARKAPAPAADKQVAKAVRAAQPHKATKPARPAKAGKAMETLSKSSDKKLEQKKAVYSALYAFNAHVAVLKQGGMSHRDAVAQAADDRKAGLI